MNMKKNMLSRHTVATASETVFDIDDDLLAFESADFPDDDSIGFSSLASNAVPLEIFEQSTPSIVSLEFHESFINVGSPSQSNKSKVGNMGRLCQEICDFQGDEEEEAVANERKSKSRDKKPTREKKSDSRKQKHGQGSSRKSTSRGRQRSRTGGTTHTGLGESLSSSTKIRRSPSTIRSRESSSPCSSTRYHRGLSSQRRCELRDSTGSSVNSTEERSRRREEFMRLRRERSLQRESSLRSLSLRRQGSTSSTEHSLRHSSCEQVDTGNTASVQESPPQSERPILSRGKSLRAIPCCGILSRQLTSSISYHTTTIAEVSKEFSSEFLKHTPCPQQQELPAEEEEVNDPSSKAVETSTSCHKKSSMNPLLKKVVKGTKKMVRKNLYSGGNSNIAHKYLDDSGRCSTADVVRDDFSIASFAY